MSIKDSSAITLAETEALLADTIEHVANIVISLGTHGQIIQTIPELSKKLEMIITNVNLSLQTQTTIAKAMESFSATFERFEERQSHSELRYERAQDRAINAASSGSGKLDKAWGGLILTFVLVILAMIMGYNRLDTGFGTITKTLIEGQEKSDIRAEKTAEQTDKTADRTAEKIVDGVNQEPDNKVKGR